MKVMFPSRIVDRHVGGNTTYARHLVKGLRTRGVQVGTMRSAKHPAMTAVLETMVGQVGQRDAVLHYSADTGPLIGTRGPSVVTVHGVASRWIDVARSERQEKIWRFRVARAIASCSQLVTVSQSAADDIADVFNVDRSRIRVIYHGIDRPGPDAGIDRPSALANLPTEFALYVGNLDPRKNLRELVAAFESPELRSLGVPLVIAGKPAWNFAEIVETINGAANTIYLGFVDDPTRAYLMRRAKLFVFPSLYEGFGFPVLEAMSFGTPVAASRRGSLAELAGPSWQLEELDADALAHGIRGALEDRAWQTRAASEGVEWSSNFSWDDSIERHLDVYRAALSQ